MSAKFNSFFECYFWIYNQNFFKNTGLAKTLKNSNDKCKINEFHTQENVQKAVEMRYVCFGTRKTFPSKLVERKIKADFLLDCSLTTCREKVSKEHKWNSLKLWIDPSLSQVTTQCN